MFGNFNAPISHQIIRSIKVSTVRVTHNTSVRLSIVSYNETHDLHNRFAGTGMKLIIAALGYCFHLTVDRVFSDGGL